MGSFEIKFVFIEVITEFFVVIHVSLSGRSQLRETVVFEPIRDS